MSLTGTDYRRYDPKRVCDICGHMWHKSELTRIAPFRWACPDDKDGLTAEDISRHNASVRPLMVRAVKNAKGLSQTPTFQQAEGAVLNLILANAPNSIFLSEYGSLGAQRNADNGLADRARATGWMAYYLGNLVLENRRPRNWIEKATTKLTALCDAIVAGQRTTTAAVPVTDGLEYGAIYLVDTPPSGTVVFDVPGNAACLLALLRAYQATGAVKYRDTARAIATFLRRSQCTGNFTAFNAQYQASSRIAVGPFPESLSISLTTSLNVSVGFYDIRISGLVCAWALHVLQVIDADASYGGGALGVFVADQGALLSRAVSDCVGWWQAGAPDGAGGPIVVGFSPQTPKQSYSAGASGGFLLNATWGNTPDADGGMSVVGFDYAFGVRSLFEVGGYTGQVGSLYSWLRGFTANPLNAVPATWGRDRIAKSAFGTYDPTIALGRNLRVRDAAGNAVATESAYSDIQQSYLAPTYDWRTVGILAPIQSAKAPSDFIVSKDELSRIRHRRFTARITGGLLSSTNVPIAAFDPTDLQDNPTLLGFTGLSFQTSIGMMRPNWSSSALRFGHYIDLSDAAIAADVYRYAPQAFPLAQG